MITETNHLLNQYLCTYWFELVGGKKLIKRCKIENQANKLLKYIQFR